MKKDGSRKLSLNRETLKPLVDDELAAVNGGESYSISWSGYSVSVSRSQSRSVSVSGDSSWGVSVSGSR